MERKLYPGLSRRIVVLLVGFSALLGSHRRMTGASWGPALLWTDLPQCSLNEKGRFSCVREHEQKQVLKGNLSCLGEKEIGR